MPWAQFGPLQPLGWYLWPMTLVLRKNVRHIFPEIYFLRYMREKDIKLYLLKTTSVPAVFIIFDEIPGKTHEQKELEK